MSLDDLVTQLGRYARSELELGALRDWFAPVLAADPLDVEQSVEDPWRDAPDESRLFWRLLHLFGEEGGEEPERAHAARVVGCLASTGAAAATLELLPLLLDQDRLVEIVARHLAGVISRTGFLSVVAESGYPAHMKLWLEHASPAALAELAGMLRGGAYLEAASALERRPP